MRVARRALHVATRPRRTLALFAATAVLLVPAAGAQAFAPNNDAASQAADVVPFTAENGTSADRYGVADLSQATPDIGTPRCLGPSSFQRTAWFRVPAGPLQRLRLDAAVSPGQPDEVPELAAFVQRSGSTSPTTIEPQACDGPETGSAAAGVELLVPAGREVLVQVGVPGGSRVGSVVLSVDADPQRQLEPPPGDDARDRISMLLGRTRAIVLRGASTTEEDPAQPACPAAGTVWRSRKVTQTGEQVIQTRGTDVATLTAFVGKRPSGDNVTGCANATLTKTETLSVPFRAKKGDTAWIRLGTNTLGGATTRAAFSGPCDQTPLAPITRPQITVASPTGQARRKRQIKLRLRAAGPCLTGARVTVRRGKRVVAKKTYRSIVRGAVTLSVPRLRKVAAPRGTYRVTVAGRVPKGRKKTFGTTKTVRLR